MRKIALCVVLMLMVGYMEAEVTNSFVVSATIHAYSSQQDQYLHRYKKGKTRYGSSVYTEGIAASSRYYPKGTRVYIDKIGKWLTVDDTLPEVVGQSNIIYVRFLTIRSAKDFVEHTANIRIIIQKKNE